MSDLAAMLKLQEDKRRKAATVLKQRPAELNYTAIPSAQPKNQHTDGTDDRTLSRETLRRESPSNLQVDLKHEFQQAFPQASISNKPSQISTLNVSNPGGQSEYQTYMNFKNTQRNKQKEKAFKKKYDEKFYFP